jgi:protein TonB
MGYQALLFCPDEKLAKVVSQVFSELDFTVEPVHEPFAAVKKLMAQRYDAIVVDCENEQNASLLFKSARNSSFNQSSLAIALVLGQAGVAKAYRIGANLVLTKPINVEQAKGTLRVARGLLRKNSDAAAAGTTSTPAPAAPAKPSPAPVSSAPQPPARPAAPPAPPVVRREVPEFEPPVPPATPAILPAMAASTEIEDVLAALPAAVLQTPAPQPPPVQVPEPVVEARQPFVPAFVKSPVDDIVKNDSVHSSLSSAPNRFSVSASPTQNPSSLFAAPGSAAAAAPAREIPAPPARETTIKPVEKPLEVLPAAAVRESAPETHVAATAFDSAGTVDGPSFAAFGEGDEESGSKKKIIIIAVALLAFIVIAYLGYEQWSKPASTTPASHPVSAQQSSGEPAPTLAPMPAPEPATSTKAGASSKPAAASALDKPSAAANPPVIKIDAEPEPETKKPAAAPFIVKSNTGTKKAQQADEAAPALPSSVASADDTSLNGLISSTASSVARPSLATVRVSQGVSQGLVIKRVQPKYPPAALATHAAGVVQIEATIRKDGTVTNLKVLSGDPMLAHAAVDAVRQWRYKPYYLDGEPVEIQTQIMVNFKPN